MQVPYGPRLSEAQKMEIARVTGIAELWCLGRLRDRPRDEALQAMFEVSRDPVVYGIALGQARASVELDGHDHCGALVDLYRAAGADEDVAAVNFGWQRHQRERRVGGARS